MSTCTRLSGSSYIELFHKETEKRFWFYLICLFDWYLFQLVAVLKPDFNCCNNCEIFWVDTIKTEIYGFVLVIANFLIQLRPKYTVLY